MRIHRIGAAVAAAAFALTAAACGGGSDAGGGGGGEADQPYVAIVSKGFQHQFWQAVKQGAEQEAARQGVRISFEGPATEADIEAQVTMLTNALGRQPDVIGFAALDSRAAAPLLQQAQSRDIPVIAFDSGVDSDIPLTTAATDNKAAAAEAAKHMAEALGGTGKVALVVHDQTSKSGTDRRDGFVEWMQANAPGIQLLEPQYGGGDQAKSADITKAIIAANPDLRGIYGSNEGSAIGVVRGVQESGVQGLTVVGFDSGAAQVEAIRNGTMLGAITQNPVGMGEQLVDAAVKATRGEQLPPVIDTGFFWYDQSNIDSPEIQEVLYQ
ncbi:ABC transporter substrate-binding protein [Pseudonocardia kunmingensis]|uniref:Monosaccharide ABC transporter substrate-binding protein (CUT2 family) n=1 Tax=Pseudonocardia kunmingensis TaxID=630975 RepID=A0A543E3M1_9PSEU|nr:ABC transporter substrate-binding protein [Pseudonocardia kunmingensis]TQM16049.1 monosaccharide ABC transporter substrate-binding protein (CUT2 family) [Pseudonocardia kunmingensis]